LKEFLDLLSHNFEKFFRFLDLWSEKVKGHPRKVRKSLQPNPDDLHFHWDKEFLDKSPIPLPVFFFISVL
jgi:hypothetical protein